VEKAADELMVVGVIEGQPGCHSTERVKGFLEGIEGAENISVVTLVAGGWNVEAGNTASMDILSAHPDVDASFAANDYVIAAEGKAILLIRSDQEELLAMSDRTGIVSHGRINTIKPAGEVVRTDLVRASTREELPA